MPGTGGGGGVQASENLALVQTTVLDATGIPLAEQVIHTGHPSRIGIEIDSKNSLSDVAVQIYIVNRAEYDDDPNTATVFPIGATTLETVEAGRRQYEAVVQVPYTTEDVFELPTDGEDPRSFGSWTYAGDFLLPGADYYLFAQVDPADVIPETDETDNFASEDELAASSDVVMVSGEFAQWVNVWVDEVFVDLDLRMIDAEFLFPEVRQPPTDPPDYCDHVPDPAEPSNPFADAIENIGNTHFSLTAVLNVSGSALPEDQALPGETPIPGPLYGVDMKATLIWTAPGESWEIPVPLWDSESEQYVEEARVRDLQPRVPRTARLDSRFGDILDAAAAAELEGLKTHLLETAPECVDLLGGLCDTGDLLRCLGAEVQVNLGFGPIKVSWGDRKSIEECIQEVDTTCLFDCFAERAGTATVRIDTTPMLPYCDPRWPDDCIIVSVPNPPLPGFDFAAEAITPELRVVLPSLGAIEGIVQAACDSADCNVICTEACSGLPSQCVGLCTGPCDNFRANCISSPEDFVAERSSGARSFEAGFDTSVGSVDKAGARLFANALAELDELGASADADGEASVSIFGKQVEVLGLDAEGAATLRSLEENYFNAELTSDLSITDRVLWETDLSPCDADGDRLLELVNTLSKARDVEQCTKGCRQEYSSEEQLQERRDCVDACELLYLVPDPDNPFPVGVSKEFDKVFFIAGIPLRVAAEGAALLGFAAGVELPQCGQTSAALFQAYAGPYLRVDGALDALVGVDGFAAAGARVEVAILNDTFYARAQVLDLELVGSEIRGTLGQDIINTLTGPNGEGNIYAEYACGIDFDWFSTRIRTCREEKELFSFETFEKTDVLFCNSEEIGVSF